MSEVTVDACIRMMETIDLTDPVYAKTNKLGHRLAASLQAKFPRGKRETVSDALILAPSSLGGLLQMEFGDEHTKERDYATALVNVLAAAGLHVRPKGRP